MVRQSAQLDDFTGEMTRTLEAAPSAAAAIDAWLNIFVRLLHTSDALRQAIRSELAEHLRERTRDLMLAGRAETESVRIAIEELGETAHLARQFEAANRPQLRRWLMHLSLIGIGTGALVTAVIALRPGESTLPAVAFNAQPQKLSDESANRRVSAQPGATLAEVVQNWQKDAGCSIVLRMEELTAAGIDPNNQINSQFKDVPLPKALDLILQAVDAHGQPIEWRASDKLIEIGTRDAFDHREIELVSYDINPIIASITTNFDKTYEEALEDISSLLTSMVDPEHWRDNGGELAHLRVVGGRLFIQAPRRMHTGVQWILAQLKEDAAAAKPLSKVAFRADPSKLRPGDVLTLSIYELCSPGKWETFNRAVAEDGTFKVPQVGNVPVAGRAVEEVESEIKSAFAKSFLQNPQIDLVLEPRKPAENPQ